MDLDSVKERTMAQSISLASDSGNLTIITGLSLAALTGVAGLATIFVQSLNAKAQIQGSLDAAVLAATAMRPGTSEDSRIAMAKAVFDRNLKDSAKNGSPEIIVTETPSFTVKQTQVSGKAKGSVHNTVGAALGITDLDIVVGAKAQKMMSGPVCVLALNGNQPASVSLYGDSHLAAADCAVQANSSSGQGLAIDGNQASATASQFGVTGGYSGSNWSPMPSPGSEPVADPYAALPVPEPGACAEVSSKLKNSSFTLDPGTYCGGLTIKAGATVKLNPGLYIMKDGPFMIGSGATVTGEDVTIALTGADSVLYFNSNSTTVLTSPQSGTYKNIQFISDRDVSDSKFKQETSTILSGASLDYDGVMYLPEQQLLTSGTAHQVIIRANSPTFGMITDRLTAQGNVEIDITRLDKRGLGETVAASGFAYGAMLIE